VSFLLDTCVLSELARPRPSSTVVKWIEQRSESTLHLSALTLAEIQRGISKLPQARKRRQLERWLFDELAEQFAGRILPVDAAVAPTWGRVQARAEKQGRRVPVIDGLIAATGIANDLIVVTRNGEHMAPTGAEIVDPWDPTPGPPGPPRG